MVLLNAVALLKVFQAAPKVGREAIAMAGEAIDTGRALERLEALKKAAREVKSRALRDCRSQDASSFQTEHRKTGRGGQNAPAAQIRPLPFPLQAPGSSLRLSQPPRAGAGSLTEKEIPRLVRAYERGWSSGHLDPAEPAYPQGGGELVSLVRPLTSLPILWKDFVISPSQIYEAKVRGAAGVLLIARDPDCQGNWLPSSGLPTSWAFCPLVEVHREEELGKLAEVSDRFALGINNRN